MSKSESITFISYSRTDTEFALKLGKDLRAGGANIWIDQLDVSPGKRWDNAVEEALHTCDTFLIILSTASVSSENVMDEFAYALDEGKKIVPVLYNDCKLPLRLRRMQYIDFTKSYDEGLKKLNNILSSEDKSNAIEQLEAQQPRKEVPSVKKRNFNYIFGLILLLIIALGIYLIFVSKDDSPVEPSGPKITSKPPSSNTSDVKSEPLKVKNTSRYVGDNRWNWTIFIEADPDTLQQIECVEYVLHETFSNPVRRVCNEPYDNFAYSTNGWGTFTVKVYIEFKDGRIETLEHPLVFRE